MVSFSSTANTGGKNVLYHTASKDIKKILKKTGENIVNSTAQIGLGVLKSSLLGTAFTAQENINVERIQYDSIRNPEKLIKKNMYDSDAPSNARFRTSPVNLSDGHRNGDTYVGHISKAAKERWFENALIPDPAIYSLMNTYRCVYNNGVLVPMSGYTWDDKGNVKEYLYAEYGPQTLRPALFNPYYGVQTIGMTRNTPLTDTYLDMARSQMINRDFTDCSIQRLVSLSRGDKELGQAKYRYSDFMYCKDLGMPNNRMITLRRFAGPVGDNIFGPESSTNNSTAENTPGDIGRLIGYFDTEENKLEDILNYNYDVTWENKNADIEIQDSNAGNQEERSKLAGLLNLFSAQYRQSYIDGIIGGQHGPGGIFKWFDGGFKLGSQDWYNKNEVLYNKDKNRVYMPMNTIRTMYIPTGEIEFKQEIQLTFVYTLRSYDGINPKSAMLDLLGNILAVTGMKGRFWGGSAELVGPQPNIAGWKKANAIINNAWDTVGGIFSSIKNGGGDMSGVMGMISSFFENTKTTLGVSFNFNSSLKDIGDMLGGTVNKILKSSTGFTDMMSSLTKNIIGRPEIYMFNSLLTGDNTGLWHLTIGNPRNPIAVMGNMIVTDAKVTHFGPLGLDDFPTGIKVTVTLKHARPRDMVDIQKMYTRGTMAMYVNMNNPAGSPGANDKVEAGGPPVHYKTGTTGTIYVGDWNDQRTRRNRNEIR